VIGTNYGEAGAIDLCGVAGEDLDRPGVWFVQAGQTSAKTSSPFGKTPIREIPIYKQAKAEYAKLQ
jgi:hypothetical protein